MTRLLVKFDFIFRLIVLILSVSLGVIFLLASAHAALAATPKQLSVVSSSKLTVGDVFDGIAPEKAAHVLGASPQPGQEMVLNASLLTRIAVAMGLSWHAASPADQVVIRRAATVIESGMIEDALKERLKSEGISGNFNIRFSQQTPQIILPSDLPASFDITNLRFDPQKDFFEAGIAAPSTGQPSAQLTVTGRVERLVSVPVLKTTLKSGDIISAPDIEWIEISASDLQKDYVLKTDEISGMTPRRVVMAGKPLRTLDLQAPLLVSRGDTVELVLRTSAMELSAQGRALQSGAKGDLVRVVNDNSNRSIEGIVTGDREVTVRQ